MTEPKENAGRLHPAPEADELEGLYQTLGGTLLRLLTGRFGVPADEVDALVERAFLALVHQVAPGISNREAWLIRTACNLAEDYRRRIQAEQKETLSVDELELLRSHVVTRAGLKVLTGVARKALHLRYIEHQSYEEIAAALGIAPEDASADDLREASAHISALLERVLTPVPDPGIAEAARRLASTPPERRHATGRALRELAESGDAVKPGSRSRPTAKTAARKRAR